MKLKDLYDKNVNIMQYFRENVKSEENSLNAILASYDLQAGSYIDFTERNTLDENCHLNNVKTPMRTKDYVTTLCKYIASEINNFEYNNILEAGVGEATSLNFVLQYLKNKEIEAYGFDLAPSRIQAGLRYLESYGQNANLFVGNMLKTPFSDNTFDITYTIHALEPNTKNAVNIVKELVRITDKYLLLFEPSYELGNQATKDNINKHKYIKNLYNDVSGINGIEIVKYELCPVGTYSNQIAIMVIKKINDTHNISKVQYSCPVCHSALVKGGENYFCNECLTVYPVIKNIPMLTAENAILFTQYMD